MYSLVNVATLVRDLGRHEHATQVATELLRAFALDEAALTSLEAMAYDEQSSADRRARVLAEESDRPSAFAVLAATRGFADELGLDAYTAAVDVLDRATIGNVRDLRTFVRRDVLASCWESAGDVAIARLPCALDIVADGVLGAWTGDDELGAIWREWLAAHPVAPATAAWPHVVDAVRALSPDALVAPAPADWAHRMHDACWAVHLTGRERALAVTALHALVALCERWAPSLPPLRVVAMVSSAVHAEVVADVLDDATRAAMSQPLFSASSGSVS